MGGEDESEIFITLTEVVEGGDISQVFSGISEVSERIFSVILGFLVQSEDIVGSDNLKTTEMEGVPVDVVEEILEFHTLDLEWVVDFLWSTAGGNEPGLLSSKPSLSVDTFSVIVGPTIE